MAGCQIRHKPERSYGPDGHQFQIMYYIKVCNKCSLSFILNKRNDLILLITTGKLFQSLLHLIAFFSYFIMNATGLGVEIKFLTRIMMGN